MAAGKLFVCVADPTPFDPDRSEPTEAEALRDRLHAVIEPMLEAAGVGRSAGTAHVAGAFDPGSGRIDAFTHFPETPFLDTALAVARTMPGVERGVAAVYTTHDLATAEYVAQDSAIMAGLGGFAVACREDAAAAAGDLPGKTIEVSYDIDAIPEVYAHPVDFRNEAMIHIERALEDAGAGTWEGAEASMGAVRFGFAVEDFERAEKIVRAAVKGTPFEGIGRIARVRRAGDILAAE